MPFLKCDFLNFSLLSKKKNPSDHVVVFLFDRLITTSFSGVFKSYRPQCEAAVIPGDSGLLRHPSYVNPAQK